MWLNKERMFLFVMLVILVWRVYMVMNPEKVEEKPVKPPSGNLDKLTADKKIGRAHV